jgi:casein kinase 1
LLKSEACYLYLLRNDPGIVKIISFGVSNKFNVLVEPLLGKTLYALFLEKKKNFTLKDICLIAIQCLNRLESVHSKGIIHCDIKPENFVIGLKDKRLIYLIDFNLSKKYRSDRTKNHIQFSITKTMTGTARYASTNALSGLQLSRRDDLESLSYIILYFLTKKLPWQGIEAKTLEKRYKKIYNKKVELEKWEKFHQIPIEIQDFIRYCRSLKFTQDPNYKKMRNYFYELMKKENIEDDGNFSWIIDKSILGSKLPLEFRRQKYCSVFKFYEKLSKSTICFNKHIFEKNKDTKRSISPINNCKPLTKSNISNGNYENDEITNSRKEIYNEEI